jgi:hypothetical protein
MTVPEFFSTVPGHSEEGKSSVALQREIETYRLKLKELLAHKGQYVLIHGDQVEGIFDSQDKALEAGYKKHLHDAFLVRKIVETEKVLFTSRNLRPCHTPPCPLTNTEQ